MPTIYWHTHPDDDSNLSVCATLRLAPGMEGARRVLVSGRWDGSGMLPGDLAIDLSAGIKGRTEENVVHSAFESVVERFATEADKQALRYLTDSADTKDSYGSIVNKKIPNASGKAKWLLGNSDIGATFRAIKYMHTAYEKDAEGKIVATTDDETVFQRILEVFDGILAMGRLGLPIEEGIDPSYAEYELLGKYRGRANAQGIKPVLEFFDRKTELRKNGSDISVADSLLGESVPLEVRRMFSKCSFDAVLRALEYRHRNDRQIFLARAREILDGFLRMDYVLSLAVEDAKRAGWYADGLVAFLEDGFEGTGDVLRRKGAKIVIYKDGPNLGVVVKDKSCFLKDGSRLSASHQFFRDLIEDFGETLLWFAHRAKFLLCNGSRKAPTDTPSRIPPAKLIEVAVRVAGMIDLPRSDRARRDLRSRRF